MPDVIEPAGALAVNTFAGSIVPLTVLYWIWLTVGSPGKFTWKKSSRLTNSSQTWAETAVDRNAATIAGMKHTARMVDLSMISKSLRGHCHKISGPMHLTLERAKG